MDVVGVVNNNNHHHHGMKREKHAKKRRSERALKVVYISSPMKVKTSASKFRALVQELTGRESDVARLMEINNGADDHHHHDFSRRGTSSSDDHHGFKHVDDYNNHHVPKSNNKVIVPTTAVMEEDPFRDSPTSSESLLFEQYDHDVFAVPQVTDESFSGLMFPSGFLYESCQTDFLKCFDAV